MAATRPSRRIRREFTDRQWKVVTSNYHHDFHTSSASRRIDFFPTALGRAERDLNKALRLIHLPGVAQCVNLLGEYLTQRLALAPTLKAACRYRFASLPIPSNVPSQTQSYSFKLNMWMLR
jgi:hypothetical protein